MPETPSPGEVAYVINLSRRHTDALGFLPRPRLEQYAARGRLWLTHDAGDLCGFLVVGNGWPILNLYQLCIQRDAQRQTHGAALVTRAQAVAQQQGYSAVACWCASDLEANQFWRAMGFHCLGVRARPNRRQRHLHRWVWWVRQPQQGQLWPLAEDVTHA